MAPGMYLHYALAADSPGDIKLEILDSIGTSLRAFSNAGRAGLHRFRWDFTLPGPQGPPPRTGGGDMEGSPRGGRGPMIAPGSYEVRLTVGQWTAKQPFRVLIDPRLPKDGVTDAVLAGQLAMSLKARDLVSDARRLAARLAEVREKASGLTGADIEAGRRAGPKLAALEARLVTSGGRYPTPMLADQIAFLYDVTLAADQQLGRDVYQRYDELAGLLGRARAELDAIIAADLPTLKAAP
jgi:hypothetical protein